MPDSPLNTVDFNAVELAHVGTFTDMHGTEVKFTEQDFDEAAASWDAIGDKVVKAPLSFYRGIIGHGEGQSLLASDEEPAAGWLTNVRREGTKLLADIKKVPAKLGKLIEAGAYRTRSIGLRREFEYEGTTYKNVIDHLAFLGARPPAIKGMDDVLALYGENEDLAGITVVVMAQKDDTGPDSKTKNKSRKEEMQMLTKIRETLNLSEEVTDDDVMAAVVELKEKAEKEPEIDVPDGMVQLSEEDVTKLREDAAAGKQAAEDLSAMKIDSALTELMESGKLAPAQKDDAKAQLTKDFDGFMKFMENAPVVIEAGSRGAAGSEVTESQKIDALLADPANAELTYAQLKAKVKEATASAA